MSSGDHLYHEKLSVSRRETSCSNLERKWYEELLDFFILPGRSNSVQRFGQVLIPLTFLWRYSQRLTSSTRNVWRTFKDRGLSLPDHLRTWHLRSPSPLLTSFCPGRVPYIRSTTLTVSATSATRSHFTSHLHLSYTKVNPHVSAPISLQVYSDGTRSLVSRITVIDK